MMQGQLEFNVLTLLVWHPEHSATVATAIGSEIRTAFSTRSYRWIAESAVEYLDRFRRPPRGHIKDLLEKRIGRGDEGKLIDTTCSAMEVAFPNIQPDFIIDSLERFVDVQRMQKSLENAIDALNIGDLEGARDAVYNNGIKINLTEGTWLHKPEQSLRFLDEKDEDFFSTGVSELDRLGAHPARKELMIVMAPPGRGKSWWLIEMGKMALMARKKVLHITLEMREQLVAQRYLQALFSMSRGEAITLKTPYFLRDTRGDFSGIDFTELNHEGIRLETKTRIIQRMKILTRRPPLLIKEFPSGSLTIPQLNRFLDSLKTQHSFVPDMLLLDYADLMKVEGNTLRTDTGRNFVDLRGMMGARNIAGVTATQGNRESATAEIVRANMVSEDWSKIMTSDIVATYSQTELERRQGLARLFVAKSRNSVDQYTILITQAYEVGQFCMDSIYMDGIVRDEIKRLIPDREVIPTRRKPRERI